LYIKAMPEARNANMAGRPGTEAAHAGFATTLLRYWGCSLRLSGRPRHAGPPASQREAMLRPFATICDPVAREAVEALIAIPNGRRKNRRFTSVLDGPQGDAIAPRLAAIRVLFRNKLLPGISDRRVHETVWRRAR
jgi:hypothetical protein